MDVLACSNKDHIAAAATGGHASSCIQVVALNIESYVCSTTLFGNDPTQCSAIWSQPGQMSDNTQQCSNSLAVPT